MGEHAVSDKREGSEWLCVCVCVCVCVFVPTLEYDPILKLECLHDCFDRSIGVVRGGPCSEKQLVLKHTAALSGPFPSSCCSTPVAPALSAHQ